MTYRYRITQEELSRIYDNAQARMKAHPEHAIKQKKVIEKCSFFETEKDALQAALELMQKEYSDYQVWAKVEKSDGIYRILNYWLVTDDGKTKLAADYIGMALMYDDTRLQNIIEANESARDERLQKTLQTKVY